MNTGQLIEKLKKYPADTPIVTPVDPFYDDVGVGYYSWDFADETEEVVVLHDVAQRYQDLEYDSLRNVLYGEYVALDQIQAAIQNERNYNQRELEKTILPCGCERCPTQLMFLN